MATLKDALKRGKRAQFMDDDHIGVVIAHEMTYDFLASAIGYRDREETGVSWETLCQRLRHHHIPTSRGWEPSA